ncbi:hypothetical protein HDV00_012364 [Rhizophlyctis rosea]|nr:hypothetical protein HDV00_012364 [Rhizophlyctis rosea]
MPPKRKRGTPENPAMESAPARRSERRRPACSNDSKPTTSSDSVVVKSSMKRGQPQQTTGTSTKRQKRAKEPSPSPVSDDSESAFESEAESEEASSDNDDDDFNSEEEEDHASRKARKSKVSPSAAKAKAGTVTTEETGFGTITRIKIPPRPVPKRKGPKGTIYDFTMDFLKGLKENNDRDWFRLHEASKENFLDFVDVVMKSMRLKDVTIRNDPPKGAMFRINRDIRFSADKTPYKTNLSAAFSRSGKKGPHAGYYISIGSSCFAGGGLWNPTSNQLASIRHHIDTNATPLLNIVDSAAFKKAFPPGGIKGLHKSAESHDAVLKTAPKGYAKDHEQIELLRLKAFVAGREWRQEEVLEDGFAMKVVEVLGALVPLVTLLNSWM